MYENILSIILVVQDENCFFPRVFFVEIMIHCLAYLYFHTEFASSPLLNITGMKHALQPETFLHSPTGGVFQS